MIGNSWFNFKEFNFTYPEMSRKLANSDELATRNQFLK